MHTLDIIISRTNTLIGKSIRKILGGYFNHCSIAFDNDFSLIYSFSRKYRYFWFTGCFCTETIDKYEDYIVYQIVITDNEYNTIIDFISELSKHFRVYNYLDAVLCSIGIEFESDYSYICSTFVSKILSMTNEIKLDKNLYTYRPMDIFELLNRYNLSVIKKQDYIIACQEVS